MFLKLLARVGDSKFQHVFYEEVIKCGVFSTTGGILD